MTTRFPLALFLVLALAARGQAAPSRAPAPTVIVVEVDRSKLNYVAFLTKLPQATAEPGGFEITAQAPKEWFLLGLEVGDVIRAENGRPVEDRLIVGDGLLLLDVIRKGKLVMLRITVYSKPTDTHVLKPQAMDSLVDLTNQPGERSAPVQRNGVPSGVRVIDTILTLYLDVTIGDVIRTIDGNPIHADAELSTALQNLRVGKTDIVLERQGRPVTLTIDRKARLDLSKIRRVNATSFEVPRSIVDAIDAEPMLLTRNIKLLQATSNGQLHGWRLFEVPADSLCAAVGLQKDDIVLDVDGMTIDTDEQAFRASGAFGTATSLTVHIVRKGKPVAINYTIR
jgi:hypothetical protein